jgi:hypothetical protein
MARLALCLVVAVLAIPCSASGAPSPVVRVPDGFLDLSHGVPESLVGKLPPTIEQEATSGTHLAYAIDLSQLGHGPVANMRATESRGVLPDPPTLTASRDGLAAAFAKIYPGMTLKIASASPVSVGQFHGVRVVLDIETAVGPLRQLLYLLPLGEESLMLTYTAARSAYEAYEPRFDASALATTGLQAAPTRLSFWELMPAILGGTAAAVTSVFIGSRKKRKAAAAKPPPGESPAT